MTTRLKRTLWFLVMVVMVSRHPATVIGQPSQCGNAVAQGVGNYFSQDLLIVRTASGSYGSTGQSWQQLPSPNGQPIQVGTGGSLYVYDKGSSEIHQSLDGGQTWTLTGVFTYTDPMSFESLFASPVTDTIFIGVSYPFLVTGMYSGTYKSSDGGLSWHKVITDLGASKIAFSLNFAQDGIAFANVNGISKTEDGGETWFSLAGQLHLGNLSGITVTSVSPAVIIPSILPAVSPQFPKDHTVFVISGGGVSKSIDSGTTWSQAAPIPGFYQTDIALSPNYLTDQTLFVGDSSVLGGLFISRDGAQTWQKLNFPYTPNNVGLRLSGPFGRWPAPPPVSVGPYSVYLPLIRAANINRALELWAIGYEDAPYQTHLMRSSDLGVTWQQICVFEAQYWQYLPIANLASVRDP